MKKRVTAAALALVMGCSAIFDSGLVVANAAVGPEIFTLLPPSIEITNPAIIAV